jgi:hypothetical protein
LILPADPDLDTSAWIHLIMADEALSHALIAVSALNVNLVSSSKDSLIPNKHSFEAVRLINCRLKSIDAISDATIMTVLFMAKIEASPITVVPAP